MPPARHGVLTLPHLHPGLRQTSKLTPPALRWPVATYADGELELEWGPLKERRAVIIASCRQPVWPGLLDVHAVDDFVVSSDLTHGRAAVPQEDSPKPLPSERSQGNRVSVRRQRNTDKELCRRLGQHTGQRVDPSLQAPCEGPEYRPPDSPEVGGCWGARPSTEASPHTEGTPANSCWGLHGLCAFLMGEAKRPGTIPSWKADTSLTQSTNTLKTKTRCRGQGDLS